MHATAAAPRAAAPVGVLALCFLVSVLEGYDLQVISSAGPFLQRSMGLAPHQLGLFFSASLIGLAVGAIAGGWLADRFGRKSVLIWSVLGLGIFTLASAFARDFPTLIALRVLAGIGMGGAMPTVIALVAEVTGGARTTSAVTTMICGQPLGGVISALVGRTVAETYGWQSLFLVGGVLTILITPILMRGLPETHPTARSGGNRMAAFAALFGEGRAAASVLLWIVFILTLALLSILLSWTPLLVMGKGLTKAAGLNAIIAINIGGILGGMIVSRWIDRAGVRWPLLALYAIVAISLFVFARTIDPTLLMGVAVLVGFGILGAQFSLYGVAPRIYPAAGRGTGVGIAVAMGRIGSVTGPLVIGALIGSGASAGQVVAVMAPVALAAAAALMLLTLVAGPALAAQRSH